VYEYMWWTGGYRRDSPTRNMGLGGSTHLDS
jgi:hypothetical protein